LRHAGACTQGSERAEAQTFLNDLLERYGSHRRDVGAESLFVGDLDRCRE
jgi:phosphoheptose isomerase